MSEVRVAAVRALALAQKALVAADANEILAKAARTMIRPSGVSPGR